MSMNQTKNGKVLLVESCKSNAYKNLTNIPKYKSLVEKARNLWINTNYSKLDEDVKKEASKLQEGVNDGAIIAKVTKNLMEKGLNPPTLWKFPISRVNTVEEPNINGRVYTDELWENVLNNQRDQWQYNTGLSDHPEDDGHFRDQGIVWLDGLKENGIVFGIGALVGEVGKLAEQIMSVGGKIGFSTAGYGEVLAEGIVDPNSYEIERFADLVLNPSQGVFGNSEDQVGGKSMTTENKENTMKKTVNESVKAKSLLEDEEVENQNEEAEDQNTEDEEGSKEAETEEGSEENSEENSEEITESEDGESEDEESEDTEEGDEESGDDEGSDEDEEDTLSEQLIVQHYSKKIAEQAKRPGREWQEKIHALEGLVAKLKKENLSEKNKKTLNTKIATIIESIMKETEKVIQIGYDAKDVCESVGITNIKMLENVHEKIEEMAALEECLVKSKKEADKYKSLYEDKEAKFVDFAKESYATAEELEEATKRRDHLSSKVVEQKKQIEQLNRRISMLESRNNKLQSKNDQLSDLLEEVNKTNSALTRCNKGLNKNLSSYRTAEQRAVREQKEFTRATTDITSKMLEKSDMFRESGIDSYLDAIDGSDAMKKAAGNSKTITEAETKLLFAGADEMLNERADRSRSRINRGHSDSITSLAEMFK